MLRIFLLALVTMLSLLATSGCGSGADSKPPAATRTLRLYSELDSKFTQDLVESFNKINKDGLVVLPLPKLRIIEEPLPKLPPRLPLKEPPGRLW